MIEVKEQGTLLSAKSKPYIMNGNSGTSHKVRVLVKGEIFECNSTPEQVADLSRFENETGEVTLSISSPKEKMKAEVTHFEPDNG